MDIKTNGGYVVIPGSVTAKGRYEVTNAADPAELPEWFRASYNRRKSTAQKEEKTTLNLKASITPDTPDKIEAALSIIDSWPEAGRRGSETTTCSASCGSSARPEYPEERQGTCTGNGASR